ncbi:MAG TPA: magnesium transporter [Lacipirellulaceae bacterium]|jgi:magnesium transporter|nr:magnesium transporter [Lacipirellulaceae bacterium]
MSILEKLTLPEIRELIQGKDCGTLREVLADWMPQDVADLLNDLAPGEDAVVLAALDPELAARSFEHLSPTAHEDLIREMHVDELSRLLNGMSPDDRTAMLEREPPEEIERLLMLLRPEEQRIARSLMSYGAGTVGRLMTPDFVTVKREWTVEQVLDHVRRYGKDSETLNVVYVTDDNQRLIDDLRIREILLSPPNRKVEELMDEQFVALSVTEEESEAVTLFRKYDRTALPVIDGRGVLIGIVTVDDVLDVQEEEATREIQRFGGLEALDESYRETPVWEMIRKRASWLVILFVGEMFTATAMAHYGEEMHLAEVLVYFIPLIISSGGNSGSQAATLLVRALAVGEVRLRDWLWVMRRELFSGLMLGILLGTIGFFRIVIWSHFTDIYGPYWFRVALTVAFALVGIVMWGTLSGSMLPIILKRLGLDPATSSAPFVATLVDVTGLIIYFTVARLFLHGTLL